MFLIILMIVLIITLLFFLSALKLGKEADEQMAKKGKE